MLGCWIAEMLGTKSRDAGVSSWLHFCKIMDVFCLSAEYTEEYIYSPQGE